MKVQPQPEGDIAKDLKDAIQEQKKAAIAWYEAKQKKGVKI